MSRRPRYEAGEELRLRIALVLEALPPDRRYRVLRDVLVMLGVPECAEALDLVWEERLGPALGQKPDA